MDPPMNNDPVPLQQQRLRFMFHCVTALYLMIASLLGARRAPPQPFHTLEEVGHG